MKLTKNPKKIANQPKKSTLVLLGCGHAHVFFIEALKKYTLNHASNLFQQVQILLITPDEQLYYSGIFPSVLAGHIDNDFLCINVLQLLEQTPIVLMLDKAVALDADKQTITTQLGEVIGYDWLSINTGAAPLNPWHSLHPKVVSIKPIDKFIEVMTDFETKQAPLNIKNSQKQIVLVGGGIASVEMACALKYRLKDTKISIVSPQLLKHQTAKVAKLVHKRLTKMNIDYVAGRVQDIQIQKLDQQQKVMIQVKPANQLANNDSDKSQLSADFVVIAMGANAPKWINSNSSDKSANTNLEKSHDDYILVNKKHQSTSHANVFATGDVCSRQDINLPKAGVYAVRAGEVLRENLMAVLQHLNDVPANNTLENKPDALQQQFIAYQPKTSVLQMIAMGERYAIASYANIVFAGRWVWYVKKWIDVKFIKRFRI